MVIDSITSSTVWRAIQEKRQSKIIRVTNNLNLFVIYVDSKPKSRIDRKSRIRATIKYTTAKELVTESIHNERQRCEIVRQSQKENSNYKGKCQDYKKDQ